VIATAVAARFMTSVMISIAMTANHPIHRLVRMVGGSREAPADPLRSA
jgi:hypothetical protein